MTIPGEEKASESSHGRGRARLSWTFSNGPATASPWMDDDSEAQSEADEDEINDRSMGIGGSSVDGDEESDRSSKTKSCPPSSILPAGKTNGLAEGSLDCPIARFDGIAAISAAGSTTYNLP